LFAALYDIHGNLPALQAVGEEILDLDVEYVIVGGDVLPGPLATEAIDYLAAFPLPVHLLCGNGDREVLARAMGTTTDWYIKAPAEAQVAVDWTARQLEVRHIQAIQNWPTRQTVDVLSLGVIDFIHASPRNDTDCITKLSDEDDLAALFRDQVADLFVCGHTHMQFDRRVGAKRIVNAGSVGMPFGRTGADWLLIADTIEFRHTDYDLSQAAARIARSEYPDAWGYAQKYVLNPPEESLMLRRLTLPLPPK